MNIFNKQAGQSLIEAVVSLSVAGLIVVALVAAVVVAVRNVQFSRSETRAVELNRQAAEWLRAARKKSWSEFIDHDEVIYCFNTLGFNNQGRCDSFHTDGTFKYQREVEFDKETEGKVKVTITTIWEDHRGSHSRKLVTYLTKW